MKTLCSKPIFIFSIRSLITRTKTLNPEIHHYRISHFSTSSNASYHSSPSRRHDEESRNVRVSVWWDFENCHLHANTNVFKVTQSITAAVRANGIKGPIQITAFGDVMQLSRSNQEALSSTGITLTHIPNGGKNSADRSLLVDLMYWVSQNPPPAHLFLISGDKDFASILHRLRLSNYNILLATSDCAPGVLCSAASITWQWNALIRGENLTGKHFNQPPDGPYGSWYGHSRAPIEDPFAISNQPPSCSQQTELTESNSDPKPRPVPKAVVNVIRNILKSYPEGLSITGLRSELGKSNVTIDKNLYGHKKFSRFLLSMPHVVKVQWRDDGQFFLFGNVELAEHTSVIATDPVANTKDPELISSSMANVGESLVEDTLVIATSPVANTKGLDFISSSKTDVKGGSYIGAGNEKLSASSKLNVKKHQAELQEPVNQVEEPQIQMQDPSPPFESVRNGEITLSQLHPMEESSPMPEAGFLKRIWRKWFSGKDRSEEKSCDKVKKCSTSEDSTDMKKVEVKCEETAGQSADPTSLTLSTNEQTMNEEIASSSGANDDKSRKGPGFFNQVKSWCKFRRSNQNSSNSNEECSESNTEIPIASEMQEMFSESFWNDMLAFLITPKGSDTILQSRTRKEMVENLQEHGPSRLQPLSESHLLHLVDLLVSDKRWVEECQSQTFPFRLVLPAGKTNPVGSKESMLGSSQKQPEQDGEKKCQNLPHSGLSLPTINNKPSLKSRSRILSDCQKLVNKIVKEYPDGFNIGKFRKLFFEKYGYTLEVQMLGYQKLATLLQIMPGVKIESKYIISSENVPNSPENNYVEEVPQSDGELSDVSRKKDDDDVDFPWEELGPVAKTNTTVNDEMKLSRKIKEDNVGQIQHDFEMLSDDDSSDLEEERESRAKPSTNNEDSSLLQILDSWYSTKENNNNRRVAPVNGDKTVDNFSNNGFKVSLSGEGVKDETNLVNCGRKQRHSKRYSFVADKNGDNREKLIDGVLSSLKKSGDILTESRTQS